MTILAVGAHPDDIEFQCAGTLAKYAQQGEKVIIAISTNGKSPALAQRLRRELQEQFGPEYAAWLDWLGAAREVLRAQASSPETARRFLHEIASKPMFERFVRESALSADKGAH